MRRRARWCCTPSFATEPKDSNECLHSSAAAGRSCALYRKDRRVAYEHIRLIEADEDLQAAIAVTHG